MRLLVGTPLSSLSSAPARTDQYVVVMGEAVVPELPLSGSLASHDPSFPTVIARTGTEGLSLVLQSSAVALN